MLHGYTYDALLAVAAANAKSLRELCVGELVLNRPDRRRDLEAVVQAAPLLEVLHARKVRCNWEDAPRIMQREPPFAPMRLHSLEVSFYDHADVARVAPFAAALADTTLQPTLTELKIHSTGAAINRPELLDALVDGMLARGLVSLSPPVCRQLLRCWRACCAAARSSS